MELEDLKKNWELVEKRLERLEQQQEQEQQHVAYHSMQSTVKRLKQRLLRQSCILWLVPLNFWLVDRNYDGFLSLRTWVMLALFFGLVVGQLLHKWWLLERLDSLECSVREACVAANRFRRSFKVGVMVNVPYALLLLASLELDFASADDSLVSDYMQTGFLVGLLIGLPLGVVIFLRAWRDVKELRRQAEGL